MHRRQVSQLVVHQRQKLLYRLGIALTIDGFGFIFSPYEPNLEHKEVYG
jgi:hypothetical protein